MVPTHRNDLTDTDRVSLTQAVDVLGPAHDLYVVIPPSVDPEPISSAFPDVTVRHLPEQFFGSLRRANEMMLSVEFYRAFEAYDFVLIHHLDAYVFRDDLAEWCGSGYDYVGPPWWDGAEQAADDAALIGSGNGGFSLRRIEPMRRIVEALHAPPRRTFPNALARKVPYPARAAFRQIAAPLLGRLPLSRVRREQLLAYLTRGSTGGEDRFWGMRVSALVPEYRVAPAEVAVRFAFDMHPRRLYERLGVLPFGCHGWTKYDRDFWNQHIPQP